MRGFVTAVHDGNKRGATGERFATVVNIGIGGSDLGPRVAAEALTTGRADARMDAQFLSNVDGHAFLAAIQGLDPARTLFLVASKTFTTLETQTNAHAARDWLAGALGDAAVGEHFAALSTNLKAVAEFGIAPDRTFGFRDWVGGRYSLWSPVGPADRARPAGRHSRRMLDGAVGDGPAFPRCAAAAEPAGAAWRWSASGTSMSWAGATPVRARLSTSGCGVCRRSCSSSRWRATASA